MTNKHIYCILKWTCIIFTCLIVASTILKLPDKLPTIIQEPSKIPYTYLGEFDITHYTHTGNCCKNGYYPTLRTVAVDPNTIPLGSLLYIEGYGIFVAMDTGSAIKGNRLDVFVNTKNEAIRLGYKSNVKVYVIEES